MTGPEGPGDDWGFPEVGPAGPSSTALPPPEVPEQELVFDTGSDAWWLQQAEAQRRAAATEPPVAPVVPPASEAPAAPETVEPEVLNAPSPPSPLDREWLPPHLPELRAPEEPAAPAADEPVTAALLLPDLVVEEPPAAEAPVVPAPVAEEPAPAAPAAWAEPVPVAPEHVEDEAHQPLSAEPEVAAAVAEPAVRAPYVPAEPVGRSRVLAGALLALAGVGLGIGALFLINGNDDSKQTSTVANPPVTRAPTTQPTVSPTSLPSTGPTASAPPVVVKPPTSRAPVVAVAPLVPVSVLNNSRVHKLADRAATRFRNGGWTVPKTGNYTGLIQATTVYYGTGQKASAERFAKQFGIARVLPRSALPGIPVAGMTVVLTRDYQA